MRSDLNKQLCEHERVGSSNNFGEHRHDKRFSSDMKYEDEERYSAVDAGSGYRESMKRRYAVTYSEKSFSENFAPLWGAIRKNLNRPWDKVYSDICKVFDKRSVINQHILIHLFQFVETDTYVGDDGQVMIRDRFGNHDLTGGGEYYVHPKTGILLRNRKFTTWRSRSKQRAKDYARQAAKSHLTLVDGSSLKKEEGIWFHIRVEETEYAVYGGLISPESTERKILYMAKNHREIKRTLSKKDLRDYDLTNG